MQSEVKFSVFSDIKMDYNDAPGLPHRASVRTGGDPVSKINAKRSRLPRRPVRGLCPGFL